MQVFIDTDSDQVAIQGDYVSPGTFDAAHQLLAKAKGEFVEDEVAEKDIITPLHALDIQVAIDNEQKYANE